MSAGTLLLAGIELQKLMGGWLHMRWCLAPSGGTWRGGRGTADHGRRLALSSQLLPGPAQQCVDPGQAGTVGLLWGFRTGLCGSVRRGAEQRGCLLLRPGQLPGSLDQSVGACWLVRARALEAAAAGLYCGSRSAPRAEHLRAVKGACKGDGWLAKQASKAT